MLKVVTVLRKSQEYTKDKVIAISKMIQKHLTLPHEFICLSDEPSLNDEPHITNLALTNNWKGWYSKMEIYSLEGPCLYLDLDTIITGNIDEIVLRAIGNRFVILRDFYRGFNKNHPKYNTKAMGSGLMFWQGSLTDIYFSYQKNPISINGGDQILLETYFRRHPEISVTYWQDITDGVCSFKCHVLPKGGVLPHMKIVCFHGQPRPWNQTLIKYQ